MPEDMGAPIEDMEESILDSTLVDVTKDIEEKIEDVNIDELIAMDVEELLRDMKPKMDQMDEEYRAETGFDTSVFDTQDIGIKAASMDSDMVEDSMEVSYENEMDAPTQNMDSLEEVDELSDIVEHLVMEDS